jgi:hypothetical protein
MWWIVFCIVLGLAIILTVAICYGSCRLRSIRKEMLVRLEEARCAITTPRYDAKELNGLPAPVQRYFRTALRDGQPIVSAATLEQSGTFNMGETADRWKSFAAIQHVFTRSPGFDWEARIRIAPFMPVTVHDAYIAGEGILHATLLGLATVADQRGTPEMAQGELMRFLAEAAWYPTALLPGFGVQWEGVDDSSAKATLKDGATAVTILFRFTKDNQIESVQAKRPRMIGEQLIPTLWEGRWSSYELHEGMSVPAAGEVAWILPEGRKLYWRGSVKNIRYEFVQ